MKIRSRRQAVFVLFYCFLASSDQTTVNVSGTWHRFKELYGKSYSADEEPYRRALFKKHAAAVTRHNIEASVGLHTDTRKLYEWSDFTEEERKERLSCYTQSSEEQPRCNFNLHPEAYPVDFDYRKLGVVTPVIDQDTCGSCYVFSALAPLESHWALRKHQLRSLSAQNYLDCAGRPRACKGGRPAWVYDYVIQNDGIDTEDSYPYESDIGSTCKYKKQHFGATCRAYCYLDKGDETIMQGALYLEGPLSVSLNFDTLTDYSKGIHDLHNKSECSKTPDHAVTIVGYGKDLKTKTDYWIVKNSWGWWWGEKGYFRLRRNKNLCGIGNEPLFPVI